MEIIPIPTDPSPLARQIWEGAGIHPVPLQVTTHLRALLGPDPCPLFTLALQASLAEARRYHARQRRMLRTIGRKFFKSGCSQTRRIRRQIRERIARGETIWPTDYPALREPYQYALEACDNWLHPGDGSPAFHQFALAIVNSKHRRPEPYDAQVWNRAVETLEHSRELLMMLIDEKDRRAMRSAKYPRAALQKRIDAVNDKRRLTVS